MLRLITGRLLMIPPAILFVHFLGYGYSLVAQQLHARRNPFHVTSLEPSPLPSAYGAHLQRLLQGQFEPLRNGKNHVALVMEGIEPTFGLLALALGLSLILGLLLGLQAVRTSPPGAATWLIPFSTVGLAMPGFYIGILLVTGLIFYTLQTFSRPPLPFGGFGWDRHLILPLFTLSLRPALQLAQVTSRLLGEELRHQYVIAARSFGYTWRKIRWKSALRNILVPVILATTSSFRLLLGEIVLIELLFNWPGIGRMLALTLIQPQLSSGPSSFLFLNPPVLALLLAIFTTLLLGADLATSILVRLIDPRLRAGEKEVARG